MRNPVPLITLIAISIIAILTIYANFWFDQTYNQSVPTPLISASIEPTIDPSIFPTTPILTIKPTNPMISTVQPTITPIKTPTPTIIFQPTAGPSLAETPKPIPTQPQSTMLAPNFLQRNASSCTNTAQSCSKTIICPENTLTQVNAIITTTEASLSPIDTTYSKCITDNETLVNQCTDLPCLTKYTNIMESCETVCKNQKNPIITTTETELTKYCTIIGCEQ